MMVAEHIRKTSIFGGMASIDLPGRMDDISHFRPVPDHQEVFADASMDQSVVIEILSRADVSDIECGSFFWRDCCQENSATDACLEDQTCIDLDSSNFPASATCYLLKGSMKASKGRQAHAAANTIQALLAVLRLPHVESDVVISLMTPTNISQQSTAAAHAGAGEKTAHLSAPDLFNRLLTSFKINDWSLFGHDVS